MRIHWQARESERDAADNIGSFTPDAGERHEIGKVLRDLTLKTQHERRSHANEALCLILIEAG